jgi:hypothetical protein
MHPREYLSHSQKKTWKRSSKEYIEKYLRDKQQFVTKEMRFGTKMADALQDDELTGDPILDMVMEGIPKFELRDIEMRGTLKIGKEEIIILVKMDTSKEDLSAFKEYKTGKDGKGGWTQAKVDEDSQITFYATYCYIMTKKIPQDISLEWVITKDEIGPDGKPTGKIVPTGEIRSFPTHRTMGQIINEMADMRKVWKEIGEACEKELL